MVVCYVTQESGTPGKNKMWFSHLCSFEISYPIEIKFLAEVPTYLKLIKLKLMDLLKVLANFRANPMKIYEVISNFSCETRLICCHAYRVNCFEELVEGVTIVGVPFMVSNKVCIDIWNQTQPVSKLCNSSSILYITSIGTCPTCRPHYSMGTNIMRL